MGPGAFKHRGALHLRFRRRISDRHQLIIKIEHRVAFAFRSRGYDGWIVGDANGASSCCSPLCAETLPLSKVTGLSRWRHAPLQVWSPRTTVRARCLPFDHMIGRQYPRRGEPDAPLPRWAQHRNAAADIVGCQVKSDGTRLSSIAGLTIHTRNMRPIEVRPWSGDSG
jgi:hypothetical protein